MLACAKGWSSLFLGLSLCAAFSASVRAEKHPAEQKGIKSINSNVATQVRFVNGSGGTIKVYWLNFDGKRELHATLRDGEPFLAMTFLTHPWLVTTDGDKPLGLYFPDAQPRAVRITAAGDQQPVELTPRPADSWAEALDHYARRFDVTSEMKNRDQKEPFKAKGASAGQWSHEGAFLKQSWAIEPGGQVPAMNGSSIMTFDPRKKLYRRWTFISGGNAEESSGQWDAKTRTLTWTAAENQMGGETVTKSAFDKDGRETWSIEIKDRDGNLASTIRGIATPRKEKD